MSAATVRRLEGGYQERYEFSIDSGVDHAYALLLEAAAGLVRDLKPGAVNLSGIWWVEGEDEMRLDVFVEDAGADGVDP